MAVKGATKFCSEFFKVSWNKACSSLGYSAKRFNTITSSVGAVASNKLQRYQSSIDYRPWRVFFSDDSSSKKENDKLDDKCNVCNVYKKWHQRNLTNIKGTIYSTSGSAFMLQKSWVSSFPPKETPSSRTVLEKNILEKLEKSPELQDVKDPLPDFQSVGQRLVDLSEKKLHPLYRKYLTITPKPSSYISMKVPPYKSISGPIKYDDIPLKLKIKKHLLNKKNIYCDFKRVEPPRHILTKLIEIKLNEKPNIRS